MKFTPEYIKYARASALFLKEPISTEYREALDEIVRLQAETINDTIFTVLTKQEQATILQYIRDRISRKEIDVDLLPRWLMSLHEDHLELQKLKEEIRWISVSERLPEKETANCSRTVFLEIDNVGLFKAYYNYAAGLWVSLLGTKIFFQDSDFKNVNARWVYEPQLPEGK